MRQPITPRISPLPSLGLAVVARFAGLERLACGSRLFRRLFVAARVIFGNRFHGGLGASRLGRLALPALSAISATASSSVSACGSLPLGSVA